MEIDAFNELAQHFKKGNFIRNKILDSIFCSYDLFLIQNNLSNNLFDEISKKLKSSEIIVKKYEGITQNESSPYIIIGTQKTIIFIHQSCLHSFQELLASKPNKTYFFKDSKLFFDNANIKNYDEINENELFYEIWNLKIPLHPKITLSKISRNLWSNISKCINFLIFHKSYEKLNKDRIKSFNENNDVHINNDDYLILKDQIGIGSFFKIALIYHFQNNELMAMKYQAINDPLNKPVDLIKREISNYEKFKHPFLPKYYGNSNNKIFMEYINGKSLLEINKNDLTDKEKFTIIFEIMIAIDYIHSKSRVYRDLKPNNIMIDSNLTVVLIDFDSTIKWDFKKNHSNDFQFGFTAPEVQQGFAKPSCDVYSIGKIIYYILNGDIKNINQKSNFPKYPGLDTIFFNCIKNNPNQRYSMTQLMVQFYFSFKSLINFKNFEEIYETYSINTIKNIQLFFKHGFTVSDNRYQTLHDMGKIIRQNNNEFLRINIKKIKTFMEILAYLNNPEAQYMIGLIYYNAIYIERDIKKAINYFQLSANNNHSLAQYELGKHYIECDIKKAINYFQLSAQNKNKQAQTALGNLYLEGKYIRQDINKAIYYFELAADQGEIEALNRLSKIYYDDELVPRDITKTIRYLTSAAEQNDSTALFNLGNLYYKGVYIKSDPKKAIYYLTRSADQNNCYAQYTLGSIYYCGEIIEQNINKAFKYLQLSVDQNYSKAQNFLGFCYYDGKYVEKDINKAIHYLTLSANQNDKIACFVLSRIFSELKDKIKSDYYSKYIRNHMDTFMKYKCPDIYWKPDINQVIDLFDTYKTPEAFYNLAEIYYENKYVKRDMQKVLYYLKESSKNKYPDAQYMLGMIYYEGKYINRDINKTIYYLTPLANEGINIKSSNDDINSFVYFVKYSRGCYVNAKLILAKIYYEGKYIARDINIAIHYLTPLANLNCAEAQYTLAMIYYEGKYVYRDMTKVINYLNLSSNQNYVLAQYTLGEIYNEGRYYAHDLDKAIHYWTLAAKKNFIPAQRSLGVLFYDNRERKKEYIKKSIEYLKLAADNGKDSYSEFMLGYVLILHFNNQKEGLPYIKKAADKGNKEAQYMFGLLINDKQIAENFITLAAKKNQADAQFCLSLLYFERSSDKNNLQKGLFWLNKASENDNRKANRLLGYFYHEGKYIARDYVKAIELYKKANIINIPYAPNNLGVIYRYDSKAGKKNINEAIHYFKIAVKNHDIVSEYNLANIYIFEKNNINEAFPLLINSFLHGFYPSLYLLIIALFIKNNFDSLKVNEEIKKDEKLKSISNLIINLFNYEQMYIPMKFNLIYIFLKNNVYVHNCVDEYEVIASTSFDQIHQQIPIEPNKVADINEIFYQGLGNDIIT